MATIAVLLKLDEQSVPQALLEAGEKLDGVEGKAILDFSSVRRIDSSALKAMEEFAGKAATQGLKVVLRGVNVDIYKVLTLAQLVSRFSSVN
jgi:anti-anti-sigma regulatory factor